MRSNFVQLRRRYKGAWCWITYEGSAGAGLIVNIMSVCGIRPQKKACACASLPVHCLIETHALHASYCIVATSTPCSCFAGCRLSAADLSCRRSNQVGPSR